MTSLGSVLSASHDLNDRSSSAPSGHDVEFASLLGREGEVGDIARQIQSIGDQLDDMSARIRQFLAA